MSVELESGRTGDDAALTRRAASKDSSHLSLRDVGAYAVLALAFTVLVLRAAKPLSNSDTYFHLRFGHEFLTGAWSLRHPGSVTPYATADWVPTQWLPQVAMAWLEQHVGLAAVAWLSGLLFLTLAITVYWACRVHAGPFLAACVTALTLIACTPGMSMRPQQISYILVALTVASWLRARDTGRAPWHLVPVAYLWTMCHGMWPVGLVIGLVAVIGLALDRAHPPRAWLRMLGVPVASAAVSLATPVGPGLFSGVLLVNSRAEYFYEWGPPEFTSLYAAVLLGLLALAILPRLRDRSRLPWFDAALIGLACLWAVYSIRTVPIAACLVAPLAAASISTWSPIASRFGARPTAQRPEKLMVIGGYLAALTVLALAVPHTSAQPRETPPWVDDAMATLPAHTAIVSEQGFGGYLMWRYPQIDLVLHGYGDTYTDAELARNATIEGVRHGWVGQLRSTDARYALLPPYSALAYNLREVLDWRVVDEGDGLVLLTAPPR